MISREPCMIRLVSGLLDMLLEAVQTECIFALKKERYRVVKKKKKNAISWDAFFKSTVFYVIAAKYAKCDHSGQTCLSGACKISTEEHKNTFCVNGNQHKLSLCLKHSDKAKDTTEDIGLCTI